MEQTSRAQVAGRLSRRFSKDPWIYPLLACFLLLALLSFRLIHDADLGFHLKGGQWILQNHSFPSKDAYTYTVSDHDYIDIHWLYQTVLFMAYQAGSYPLLTLLNVLLILGVFTVTFGRFRLTGAPSWVCGVLFLWTLLVCEYRFEVRPEILSWLLMALDLWVLEQYEGRQRDFLWLLPLIQLVWVNVEGLFILGWLNVALFLVQSKPRLDLKLVKVGAWVLAASLLNPYFAKGLLFPFQLFSHFKGDSVFAQSIAEFKPTWTIGPGSFDHSFLPPYWGYKVFSLALLFLLAATWKKRRWGDFLLASAYFYLSATAVRNVPLFMLAASPLMASCWKDLPRKWVQGPQKFLSGPPAALVLGALVLLACPRVVTNAFYSSSRDTARFGLGLDRERVPVDAAQFLADHRLDGRILNQMSTGGWLDWRGPQKTFVDGRLEVMGEDFFAEYRAGEGPGGLGRLVGKYKPDIIFFNPYFVYGWVAELYQMPGWRLVYLDDYFAIFLRKGYAPEIPAVDYDRVLRERGVEKAIVNNAPSILEAPAPPALAAWLEGFGKPQDYPDGLMNLALFTYLYRQPAASAAVYLTAIQRTDGKYYEFYLNFGSLLNDLGMYQLSFLCEKRALRDDPSNDFAKKILQDLSPHLQ